MNEQPNMDKRLRQLENQSLPDMSRQEEHWQSMKDLLQTGAVPAGKPAGSSNFWYWIAAASISAVVIYMAVRPGGKKEGSKPVTETVKEEQTIPQEPASYSNDTVSMITTVNGNNMTVLQDKPRAKKTGSGFNLKARTQNGNDDTVLEARLADEPQVATKTTFQDPKASLAAFFAQLEKPSQEFVIDNRKDTVIWGNDGGALLIPANTFNTREKVKISIREFYSYQDIVTHKLSTASDGDQLETGGMIHIGASINGKEVDLPPARSIRWFLPDTSARMADMKLFTGVTGNTGILYKRSPDADTLDYANSTINWKASNSGFDRNYVSLWVKVVDLRDLPFRVTSNRQYKGYFYLNSYSDYSKNQLRQMLMKKYPHYDKIVISGKKKKKEVNSPWIELRQVDWSVKQYSIGDTTWLQPTDIKGYNLEILDTLTYTFNSSAGTISPTLNDQLKKVAGRYSVDINSLGWINCDKFYRSKEPKVQYVVNLDDKASNYYTFIVFDRVKSMMAGYEAGNKVVFPNIPVGEKVRVISVGIKDGKAIAAIKAAETSATTLTGLRFEETSPAAFREQAASLDK